MKLAHRKAHRLIWPLLALLLAVGFTMALVLRPPPEKSGEANPAPRGVKAFAHAGGAA